MAESRYISTHIENQLPDFVRADHPVFQSFLEAYYEFLEQDSNALYGSANLMDYADIDDTIESFVQHFKNQYLHGFPTDLAVNPETGEKVSASNLIKNIKEYYSNRGTEKSFNLIFQLFYNTTAELYLPKEDLLIPSSGRWEKVHILKTTAKNKQELTNTVGLRLNQVNTQTGKIEAYATVKNVLQYDGEGLALTVCEYELEDPFNSNEFSVDSTVQFKLTTGEIIEERILPIVTNIAVVTGGSAYAVGDTINFSGGGLGSGALGKVKTVDDLGRITSTEMIDYGSNYTTTPSINITRAGLAAGSGAELTATTGAIVQTEGQFLDSSGWLSSGKKLQDADYYQSYSYVIKTDITLDRFKELIKKTIHPAGMALFSQVQIRRELQSDVPFSSRIASQALPLIGHYTPYTHATSQNLGFSRTITTLDGTQYSGMYVHGYVPGSTLASHCHGETGGLVVLTTAATAGFTGHEFIYGEQVVCNGKTAQVFNWDVVGSLGTAGDAGSIRERAGVQGISGEEYIFGATGATGYLRLMNLVSGNTFASGEVLTGGSGGITGTVNRVAFGNGTVLENGNEVHSIAGASINALGGSNSTNDSPIYHTAAYLGSYGRDFWVIYNHPNQRESGNLPAGITFGSIDIMTFNQEEGAVREFSLGGVNTVSQSLNFPYVGATSGYTE